MTIHSITLTNPGAELGDTTGWTQATGSGMTAVTGGGLPASDNNVSAHSGTYSFLAGASTSNVWYQTIAIDAGWEAAIDAGLGAIKASAWHTTDPASSGNDFGALYLQCVASDGSTVLATATNDGTTHTSSWVQEFIEMGIPPLTRFVRLGTNNTRIAFANNSNYWDDFVADISDDHPTDWPGEFQPQAKQLGVYALGTFPTDQIRDHQSGVLSLGAAETGNTFFEVYGHQLGIYVLCRPNADRRELRAWTFKQDDHEFYGIQLGAGGTIVWDKLTNQWCTWKSPDFVYWRAEDVCDWEGFNLAGDTESGKIFQIDPTGRLDYGDTPITSKVVGYLTHRFRKEVPCFMAELALSEGEPPAGFDEGEVGLTLRTSTDNGQSFINHGEIPGGGISEDLTARWWGLGLMKAPGMIFEITDTGYARRIDGLDIESPEDG